MTEGREARLAGKRRRIVQIAGSSGTDSYGDIESRVFALCDDGTVWQSWYSYDMHATLWSRMPDIPQDDYGGDCV